MVWSRSRGIDGGRTTGRKGKEDRAGRRRLGNARGRIRLALPSQPDCGPLLVGPFSAQVGVKADWSPDSQRIMFITAVDEGQPDAQVNTWTIARDGSDLEAVTSYPPGGTRAFGNSYSPDGQWILLRIEQASLNALFKIRPDGTDLTQITPFSSFRPRNMAWGSALAGTFGDDD